MRNLILVLVLVLVLSACGKPKGEEFTFVGAEITDVNDWSADPSYSCQFYIKTAAEVVTVEAEAEYCSDFQEGDIVSGTYIVAENEEMVYLIEMEY